MNAPTEPPDPPAILRKLTLALFKVTKPIERVSVETGVFRDVVTPPGGWRALKANPRSKRLEDYRERWRKVDEFVEARWKWGGQFVRERRARQATEPPVMEIDSQTRAAERSRMVKRTLHTILHPHDAVRRWEFERGASENQK